MSLNSIRIRTALILLSIGVLIVLVLGGLWVYSTYTMMKSDISMSNLQDARLLSRYIVAFTSYISGMEQIFAASPDTIDAIRTNDSARLKLIGNNLFSMISEAEVVVILDPDGKILYHSDGGIISGLVVSGWFDEVVKQNGTYVTGLFYSESLKKPLFSITTPVMDNGTVIGYIFASVPPDTLDQNIQQQRINPDRNLIVVDTRGFVVSHDNNTYVKTNANLSGTQPVRSLNNATEGVVETSQTYDGQLRIVGYSQVPDSGLGVLVTSPMSVVYSQITERIIEILLMLVAFSTLLIFVNYYVSRYITDPVVNLSQTMREVSGGNYRVRAKSVRKDEIGDLSRTFDLMMDKLEHTVELTKKYLLIYQGAKDPIFFVSLDGRILDINNATLKTYGYTREEMLSMNVSDFRQPGDRLLIPEILKESFQHGCILETVHTRKDGSTFPVEISSAGTLIGNSPVLVAVVRDITERNRTAIELQDAKDQAELYLDLMGHDINNLNHIAMGFLELALATLDLNPEEKDLLLRPLDSIRGSSELISNVRKLQHIKGREALKLNQIDLCDVLEGVIKCFSDIPDRQVTINFKPSPECKIIANELINEVFSNLIGNAIKHSDPAKPLTINVKLDRVTFDGNHYIIVIIEDNGPGIPDDIKRKLFKRFERGRTKASGRGLGLYLVQTLVEKIHGKVWVEDRVPGDYTQGCKFVVLLPVTEQLTE